MPKVFKNNVSSLSFGGREGTRTPDFLVANEALSQLSYSPTSSGLILANALRLANTRSRACTQRERNILPESVADATLLILKLYLEVAVMAARSPRRRAAPRSSWRSDRAPSLAESLLRPSALVDQLPAEL